MISPLLIRNTNWVLKHLHFIVQREMKTVFENDKMDSYNCQLGEICATLTKNDLNIVHDPSVQTFDTKFPNEWKQKILELRKKAVQDCTGRVHIL